MYDEPKAQGYFPTRMLEVLTVQAHPFEQNLYVGGTYSGTVVLSAVRSKLIDNEDELQAGRTWTSFSESRI